MAADGTTDLAWSPGNCCVIIGKRLKSQVSPIELCMFVRPMGTVQQYNQCFDFFGQTN